MTSTAAGTIEFFKHSPFFFWGFLSLITGTSLPTYATLPQAPERQAEVRLLVAGDMFFDRSLRLLAERGDDYLFTCMDPLIERVDFAVGNLEGPITNAPSVSRGSVEGSPENYVFTFPPAVPALLLRHGFTLVNIGNNHIGNFGWEGVVSTREHLAAAGVGYFGGIGGSEPVARSDYGGVPLSFVGYNEFGGATPQEVAQKIIKERAEGRVVVVYTHWGDEYSTANARLAPIARMFVEAGASAVVGSHPHVVGLHETIRGAPVYYSLGNFIFDQYFDEQVSHGLVLLLTIRADGSVAVEEQPVVLTPDGRTCPAVHANDV